MTAAFVTGGAGGAGQAICEAFAQRSVPCAVVDLDGERAEQVAKDLSSRYRCRLAAVQCDVSQRESVHAAWREATSELGPMSVLVNNAGRYKRTELHELDDAAWQATLALNLTGPLLTCQRAISEWVRDKIEGSIVNVTSIAWAVGGYGGAYDYAATKAGLMGLTVQLAVDFGPNGIRTNAVSPGSFRSLLTAERYSVPGAEERAAAVVPLRRIGRAQEIAAAVIFLALDGTYVNGEEIRCDGGTTRYALRSA